MAQQTPADEELRRQLQSIDEYDFEHFVADLWEARGWETEVSQASVDEGVDVTARMIGGLMDTKAAIQVKRFSEGNKIGRPDVQRYYSMKVQDPEADAAVVVTTSSFTDGAEEWAGEHNVKLVDGDDLVELVREEKRFDLVERYVSGDGPTPGEKEDEPRKEPSEPEDKESQPDPVDELKTAVSVENEYLTVIWASLVIQALSMGALVFPGFLTILPDDGALWLIVAMWFLAPPAIFLDALRFHRTGARKKPNRLAWPVASFFFPGIVPLLYVVGRP